jgi:hypothetical protein
MPSSNYMREWRQTPAGQAALAKQKRREKARARALSALAELHASEFAELLRIELVKLECEEQDQ